MNNDERAHEYDVRLTRAQDELQVIMNDTRPNVADWGAFPNLFDFAEAVNTLLSFAHMHTGMTHGYDPDNTNCDSCMNTALRHGHA